MITQIYRIFPGYYPGFFCVSRAPGVISHRGGDIMRVRMFGRIVYVRKGVLLIVLLLAAAAAVLIISSVEKNKKLPEIQRNAEAYTEKSSGDIDAATPVNTAPAGSGTDGENTDIIENRTPEPQTLALHITGAVAQEGVFRVLPGSIVQDVIDMCGGLLTDADTYHINLAMKVNDGMRIHIPFKYDEDKTWLLDVGYASQTVAAENGSVQYGEPGLVNINTASVNELITLNGIGESTARDIIAFREEHGRFEAIEDIMKVPGIKEAKFARIKKYITV